MFTPLDYDLNETYRSRKMRATKKAQFAQAFILHTRASKVTSRTALWIINIVIITVFTLGFSTNATQAQETSIDGGGSSGQSDVNYMYLRSAIHAVRADELESARGYLDQTLDNNPEFAPAYATLAYIALLEDNNEEALEYALTAYEIYSVDPAMTFMLAESYFANEEYDLATTHYNLYLSQVSEQGYQPVLVIGLLNNDSLPLVSERLAECEAESLS